jgi:hypothetical protein
MPYKSRLKALLAKGYFPKELPSVFTTETFGSNVDEILAEWKAQKVFSVKPSGKAPGKPSPKQNAYAYDVEHAEIEIISKPKRGYERRNLHITHPVPQALLCYEIAKNWKSVQKWLLRQTFSLDEIRISESHDRSIKGINFAVHRAKKKYIESTSDWLVTTDISRFYPTIYTHSIAWAAYGKEKVKANLKLYQGALADRIDSLVRACNRNQTVGIPIGPETSRIIAEVISSRIDVDFKSKIPDAQSEFIDRLQDDWFIGVSSLEKAENALSTITTIYRDYGLEINGSKTSVERAVTTIGDQWVSEIAAFLSHRRGPIRSARLTELLTLSLRLQSKYPSEPVITYVLSILEGQTLIRDDLEALESFLLKAAVASPGSMDRICRMILNIQHETNKLSKQRISRRFKQLAEKNLENGNLYEVIWQVYTLRGLKTPLHSKLISEKIESTASSALALILLDMENKGLFVGKLPKTEWESRINKDRIQKDWMWLLAYEGIRHGWLSDHTNVMNEPFFKVMRDLNVEFYDPKKNVPISKKVVQKNRVLRRKSLIEVQRFMHVIRGFNLFEY